MNEERNLNMIAVGIDIAKATIDIWMNDKGITLKNDGKALRKFFDPIQRNDVKIVMEATGRYHRLAHRILSDLGFDVMVINPYQSRHFAQSMNIFCKTDRVDAKVLSQYAQRMNFSKTAVPTPMEAKLQDLIRHLDDLKSILAQYENRLDHAEEVALTSLKRLMKSTEKEIGIATKAIQALIKSDNYLSKRCEILTSIPGIGEATAAVLVGLLKELGNISNKEAAALAGLAPMNRDSGSFVGKRHIQKGRHDVRRFLYVPIVGAATQHNAVLKEFYDRLIAAGKPTRVALMACMRKLIVFANTLLRKGEMWASKIVVNVAAATTATATT